MQINTGSYSNMLNNCHTKALISIRNQGFNSINIDKERAVYLLFSGSTFFLNSELDTPYVWGRKKTFTPIFSKSATITRLTVCPIDKLI